MKKLYDLSTELRKVAPERVTMTTMPNRYVGARVEPTEDAEKLFRLVREDIALDGKDAEPAKAEPKAPADPGRRRRRHRRTGRQRHPHRHLAAAAGRTGTVRDALKEKGFTGRPPTPPAQSAPSGRWCAIRAPTWRATPGGSPRRSASRRVR
ncbi:hypothetical protein GCM10023238_16680 [Streptomyces heliomycini]